MTCTTTRLQLFFCIQLHVYKFNAIYDLGALREKNLRHGGILKTLYAEGTLILKALNSTPSSRFI
jgi:hypothetical protein